MSDTTNAPKKTDKAQDQHSDAGGPKGPAKDGPATKAKAKTAAKTPAPAKTEAQTKAKAAPQPDDKRAADEAPSEPPGHPHSGLRVVISILVVMAVLTGGAYATVDLWFPAAKPYLPKFAQSLIQSEGADLPAIKPGADPDIAPPKIEELQSQRERLKPEIDGLLNRVQTLESQLETLRDAARLVAPQTATSDRAEEFQNISDRLARLEGLPIEGGPPEAEALSRLAQRVARLETQDKDIGIDEEIDRLSKRLDQLEVENAETQESTRSIPAVVLAVGQLREAVLASRPFDAELKTVQQFGGDDPALSEPIATLTPLAGGGIPTVTALRRSFDTHQDAIIRAALADTGSGWLDQTLTRVASVVSVRRTGDDLSGDGVDAVVARAEAALVVGDVATAVDIIGALTGPSGVAAEPWLILARQRLEAEQALTRLHRHAISLIADVH